MGPPSMRGHLSVRADVAEALAARRPVVALESTIISHGLPRPDNLAIARRIEGAVTSAGAVAATIAVIGGQVRVGLDDGDLERVASGEHVAKVSVRDLPMVVACAGDGATTVAATAHLAALAGIPVMATGGLGGVHRGAADTFDESADLTTISRTAITVVCSGVKSILDVAATLERLETLNVGVAGYRTGRFPGFYLTDSGFPVPWRLDSPEEVAAVVRTRAALGLAGYGLVVANPLPPGEQLDPVLHDRVLAEGLDTMRRHGIAGKDVTPFLLDFFHRRTEGESMRVNIRLIVRNAELAGRIAGALAANGPSPA